MFEDVIRRLAGIEGAGPSAPDAGPGHGLSDAERIDLITALERLKSTCAAAQARLTAAFAASQEEVADEWRRQAQRCSDSGDFEGWLAARDRARRCSVETVTTGTSRHRGRRSFGVAGQVALARRESPTAGSRHLRLALALADRLPRTREALELGALSEWRAEIVVRESGMLTADQQRALDAELFRDSACPDDPADEEVLRAARRENAERVGRLGDREITRQVRAIAYRVDAESVVAKARGEAQQRRVTLRPAPDAMSYLTAYLPVAQGVALHAALVAAAGSARAAGDERSKGQVMADVLVQRGTGQATADAVPVEVQLVVSDQALLTNVFAGGPARDVPAQVAGYGTVPASWARALVRDNAAQVWLRRLYADPVDGSLVAMDSHRRTFTGGLRRLLIVRDGTCTTPWCDAPIAHLDHIRPYAEGGLTSADNGRGTCVRCNLTKEQPGWCTVATLGRRTAPSREEDPPGKAQGDATARRVTALTTRTPTGHGYASDIRSLLRGQPPRATPCGPGFVDIDVGAVGVGAVRDVGDDDGGGNAEEWRFSVLERRLEERRAG